MNNLFDIDYESIILSPAVIYHYISSASLSI